MHSNSWHFYYKSVITAQECLLAFVRDQMWLMKYYLPRTRRLRISKIRQSVVLFRYYISPFRRLKDNIPKVKDSLELKGNP